jgi:ankyrin repeat protein
MHATAVHRLLTLLLVAGTALPAVAHPSTSARGALSQAEGQSAQSSVRPDGTTPLHEAAHVDDVAAMARLVAAGADVKAANRYGVTPLWLACVNGSAAAIELLLKAGAEANTVLPAGETVLMTAARTGKVDAVNVLLRRGAHVNGKEGWRGQTALMWAAAEGHAGVIEALVKAGADVHARSNGGFTALHFAAREGQIAAAKALVAAGANLNDSIPSTTPIDEPVPEETNSPAETGLNVFLLAVANAHFELAAWLLDQGADPNAAPRGWTALHQISWVRKMGIAGSNDPAPQGSGNLSSLDFVRTLVAKGADLNARATKRPPMGLSTLNAVGATPFLLAARTADFELMRLLAELGADPRLPNEDNTTPLMVAAGVGTQNPGEDPGTEPEVLEAVKVALELGGDLNTVDSQGETVMHGAAYKHAPFVVRFLAERGARIDLWNRPNKRGWTPLRIAEGVQRGMNIISSVPTAVAIREVMDSAPRASAPPSR